MSFSIPDSARYSSFDAAMYLNVSRKTIWKWVQNGKLPHYKRGRTLFFTQEDLESVYTRKEANDSHLSSPLS